jgi:hypothetical protein
MKRQSANTRQEEDWEEPPSPCHSASSSRGLHTHEPRTHRQRGMNYKPLLRGALSCGDTDRQTFFRESGGQRDNQ